METAITVDNLSKDFLLLDNPLSSLKALAGIKREYFRALNNISFSIPKGEVVALVGDNGAGKSTLLKILAGIITDFKGGLDVQGEVSAILEVTTSFSPFLSGRQNIRRHLLLQGLKEKEARFLEPEVIEFAELGNVIDQPIFTYSRGMIAKLAFSVAVSSVNDILLIDEIIVVGDEYFQNKSFKKIKQLCSEGRTVMIAAHHIYYLERLCNKAIWLERGKIKEFGPVHDVLMNYAGKEAAIVDSQYAKIYGFIVDVVLSEAHGQFKVCCQIMRLRMTKSLHIQIAVHDGRNGILASLINSAWDQVEIPEGEGLLEIEAEFRLPQGLKTGLVGVVLVNGPGNTWDSSIEDAWGWDNSKHIYFNNPYYMNDYVGYVDFEVECQHEY